MKNLLLVSILLEKLGKTFFLALEHQTARSWMRNWKDTSLITCFVEKIVTLQMDLVRILQQEISREAEITVCLDTLNTGVQLNLSPFHSSKSLRELCGLSVPVNWEEKPEDISQQNWDNIRSVYTKVEDIDAFTGAMSETQVPGGLVGATVACILGNQFKNLMAGDRFFFTHRSEGIGNEKGLNPDLRAYALNRTLTDIICDNIEDSSEIE